MATPRISGLSPLEYSERPPAARELLESGGVEVEYHESDAVPHIDSAHLPAATAWLDQTIPAPT